MTAPAKFLFDNDFSRSAKTGSGTATPAQRQAALAEAEARGWANGYAAAKAENELDAGHRLADGLDRTATSLEALVRGLKAVEGRLEAEVVEVAVAVATKLAPALLKREPFAEIAALAAECFRHLVGAPHVVVRVSDELYEGARAKLDEIAAAGGFEGRLVVLAEPEIESGDCRIEWADGGAVRSRAAAEAVITEAIGRYLAVRRSATANADYAGAINNE